MLINDLVRLGEPLLGDEHRDDDVELSAKEVLGLIGDYHDEKVKNHFRHVIVVELPTDNAHKAKALAIQQFGDEVTVEGKEREKKKDFVPDSERALGIPFTVPSGGNPLNPQGRYGLPIYPCWTRHLDAFCESSENAVDFLSYKKSKNQLHRIDRTPGFELSEKELKQIGKEVHRICNGFTFTGKKGKHLGLVILARCGEDDPFEYSDSQEQNRIGESVLFPGRFIVPKYNKCLDAAWLAKEEEGAEKGMLENGVCSFSKESGKVISSYCKAWPWAGLTWNCPLPNGGDDKSLVESVALSTSAYRSMTLGARLFYRLSNRVGWEVLPEVFSPSQTRAGKDQAQRRKIQDLPTINGVAYLLPLLDLAQSDKKQQKAFVRGIRGMLNTRTSDKSWADGQLRSVAGFDAFLPPKLGKDNYRLTLVYYSVGGQQSDVHLRSTIEDVVPSTVGKIRSLVNSVGQQAMTLLSEVNPNLSEKRQAYLDTCFRSVPYLISRAYGGGFLWQQLDRVLHRCPLHLARPIHNIAKRMNSLVPRFPDTRFDIADEVAFMLVFREFVQQFNIQIANELPNEEFQMRHWKELIEGFERGPINDVKPESPAELGFFCGLIVRRFGGWYTKHLGNDKDYLKDRVLTFGATIAPREVVKAVNRMHDVAFRYPGLKRDVELGQLGYFETKEEREARRGDFEKRFGIALGLLGQHIGKLEKSKDEFMTGFWSGYSLQGYDRPRKQKAKSTITELKETVA